MSSRPVGLLAVFDGVDGAVDAIEALRAAGLKRFTVFSPAPEGARKSIDSVPPIIPDSAWTATNSRPQRSNMRW